MLSIDLPFNWSFANCKYDSVAPIPLNTAGEKIIYKGHPAIIEDFVSCYEGDYWDIKVEGVYPPDLKVPCYTPPGEIIKKEVARIRKEREENK